MIQPRYFTDNSTLSGSTTAEVTWVQDVGKQLDNDEITTRDILIMTWQRTDTEKG